MCFCSFLYHCCVVVVFFLAIVVSLSFQGLSMRDFFT